jgi:hypothetical protein
MARFANATYIGFNYWKVWRGKKKNEDIRGKEYSFGGDLEPDIVLRFHNTHITIIDFLLCSLSMHASISTLFIDHKKKLCNLFLLLGYMVLCVVW